MENNESKTKVERNEIQTILESVENLILICKQLAGTTIHYQNNQMHVYKNMWGLHSLKELVTICELYDVTFRLQTNKQIIIFKTDVI